jgi:hypothetical protein
MLHHRRSRIRRNNPTGSDVHVNQLLTEIAGVYWQEYVPVSAQVFPVLKVMKRGGLVAVYNKGDLNRIEAAKRAPGAKIATGDYRVTTSTSYYCHKYGLGKLIPDDDVDNTDLPFDLKRDGTRYCLDNVMLRKEKDWAASAFTTGIWSTQKNGGGGDFVQWNAAGSTPIENVREWKSSLKVACGFRPNIGVFGSSAWDTFIDHPTVVDRVKHTSKEPLTEGLVAQMLGLDKVLVFDVVETTTAEGAATTTLAQIGNTESFLLARVATSPSPTTPSAGYTLAWTGGRGTDAQGLRVKDYRIEEREGDMVEVEGAWDHKVIAADMGLFAYDILL